MIESLDVMYEEERMNVDESCIGDLGWTQIPPQREIQILQEVDSMDIVPIKHWV